MNLVAAYWGDVQLAAYWGTSLLASTWQHVQAGLWFLVAVIAFLFAVDVARHMRRRR